jgi:hypothetical protein
MRVRARINAEMVLMHSGIPPVGLTALRSPPISDDATILRTKCKGFARGSVRAKRGEDVKCREVE